MGHLPCSWFTMIWVMQSWTANGFEVVDWYWLPSYVYCLPAITLVMSQLASSYRLPFCPCADSKFHRSELLAPPSTLQSSFESVRIPGCSHPASTSSPTERPARPGPHHSHSCWGFEFARRPHKFFATNWPRWQCHSWQSRSLSWSARTY